MVGVSSLIIMFSRWTISLLPFTIATALMMASGWPTKAASQVANFHPCNAQPALPICKQGYGKRIAVKRWGAKPAPLDADAVVKASLVTHDPGEEIKKLKSSSIIVTDIDTSEILFAREENTVRSIASITKLMMALVVVDAELPLDDMISITAEDRKSTSDLPARLPTDATFSRSDLLHIALTASENSAAQALGRNYPGGTVAFVAAMNDKALALGMSSSRFVDTTGLSNENVSSAQDLVKLIYAISKRPLIQQFSTEAKYEVAGQTFNNTNVLVGRSNWTILSSKTGTTREAGDCLVMLIELEKRKLAIVLLNAQGQNGARFGDAVRVRRIVDNYIKADLDLALQ